MTFLDTNVLVCAADDTDVAKHGRACELVVRAIKGDAFMVSAQVLNEFAFDLNGGQTYCGIKAVNPFKVAQK